MIEEEVGRPINFHSYVSGVAGPEVAVLFAEEGVNGAHQDPQYNVLYRNINMYRSFVDAAEAKRVMAAADIFQIDGAHNANATAKAGWLVMPELLVQHGINCAYSIASGMPKNLIGLSTVPPNSPPAPKLWYDLPYAVALRDFFSDFKMRAQQNTRYIESDIEEAIRTHTIDTLISMLTSADCRAPLRRMKDAMFPGITTTSAAFKPSNKPGRLWMASKTWLPSRWTVRWARWRATSKNARLPSLRKCLRWAVILQPLKRASSSIPPSTLNAAVMHRARWTGRGGR